MNARGGNDRTASAGFWKLGALEARRTLDADKFQSGWLWRACLERIEERESAVHAFVHLDKSANAAPDGPFAGIPVGIKDIYDTIDMPTEYGSPIYAGFRPRRDAYAVAALRRAGAVIAGKTVTTEFAGPHPSVTRNPHDLSASPGGSSAGSAAAVACGMLPLAIGTQTGGSVIRPAAFCGVVGFKPSLGAIDATGARPAGISFDTPGVFARSVEDAAWIAGHLAECPDWTRAEPRSGPLRLLVWRPAEMDAATAAVARAFERAASQLSEAGHRLTDARLPDSFSRAEAAARTILSAETARSTASEMLHSPALVSPEIRAICAEGASIIAEALRAARRTIAEAERDFAAAMEASGADAAITPATADEAPADLSSTGDPVFNRIWTAIGAPSIVLPQCAGARGLPLGLQIVAPRGADAALIAAAAAIERPLRASDDALPRVAP